MTGRLADAILPLRRTLARVVLVYEERYFREVAVQGLYTALAAQTAHLGESLRSLEDRVILRVDILLEELWRRTESAGARQATELQRLAAQLQAVQSERQTEVPEVRELARQMMQVHQLSTEMADLRLQRAGSFKPAVPAAARERWEPHVKHLQGLSPVAALDCGAGEFLALAKEAGITAYGVDADPAAVERAVHTGLDVRQDCGLDHLQSVPDASLGGVFVSLVAHPVDRQLLDTLLARLARALQPGGIAIVESANPASFARFLEGTGAASALGPEELADRAQLAGLHVEEYSDAPLLRQHLTPVTADFSDPTLREIASGVNDLVAQLNDALYGPQEYVLILRKP